MLVFWVAKLAFLGDHLLTLLLIRQVARLFPRPSFSRSSQFITSPCTVFLPSFSFLFSSLFLYLYRVLRPDFLPTFSSFFSCVFLLRDFGAHYLERYLAFSFCNPNRVDIECHFFSLKQRKMTQIHLSVLATVMEQNVKNPVDFVNVPHCTEFFLFSQPRFSFVFLTLGRLG